jgi:hypothetical protein
MKGTHAKMKPPVKTQAVKELEQAAMLNEVALALGIKMLMQLFPNDKEFGAAARKGILEGMDIGKIKLQLDASTNQDKNPQIK